MNNLNAVIDGRGEVMADRPQAAPREGSHSARALTVLLLAALVVVPIVVADRLVGRWSDVNLFAAWVAMWMVAFAVLGLLAGPARALAERLVVRLDAWSQRVAQKRALTHYLEAARQDPRIRADLQYALDAAEWRSEGQPEAAAEIAETRRYIQWFDQYRPMQDRRADSGQSTNVGDKWWGAYVEPAAQEQLAAAEPARAQAAKAWKRELRWYEQAGAKQEAAARANDRTSSANRWRHSLLEGLLHYRIGA